MAQTLFTSQTPLAPDAIDGTDTYSMGTYLTPAVDGVVTAIRWFFPLSAQPAGEPVKANLFRNSDQAKLGGADAVFASPGSPGAWNEVALNVPVVGGTTYCATIRTPGRYVATSGASSPFPFTNGDLAAPAGAGRFTANAGPDVVFPTNNFNNGCYFVDVVFSPAGDPAEGAAALGLDLAVAASGGADRDGAAALDIGLALAAAGSAPHGGVAALVLDLALAAQGARPASGAAALGFGLALAATGSNGDVGCLVPPFPGPYVPVSTSPWESVPVPSFAEIEGGC